MSCRGRRWVLMSVLAVVLVFTAMPTVSATTAESDLVWILEGEVVPEDLYAVGNNVRVSGRVEGDLVAVAAEEVLVEGIVTGSLTVLASRVVITGTVEGSVVGGAGSVEVTGRVGRDLVMGAASLTVDGEVDRDVLAAAWSASTAGMVGRDVKGAFRSLVLDGVISGDAEIQANHLTTGAGLAVDGDLEFRADRLSGGNSLEDRISGTVANRRSLPPNVRIRAFRLMVYVVTSLLVVMGGLILVRLASGRVEAAAARLARSPIRSLMTGLALLLSPLVVVAVVGMAVVWLPVPIWGPLLVGAVPLLVIVSGLWLLMLVVSHIPMAVATGRAVCRLARRRWEIPGVYLVGATSYLVVLLIPVVGVPVGIVATLAGAGAWLGGRNGSSDTPRRRNAGSPRGSSG